MAFAFSFEFNHEIDFSHEKAFLRAENDQLIP